MFYQSIKLNENGKAVVCPHCENEELAFGDFCKICGIDLINRCSDTRPTAKGVTLKSCGTILDGNARYCSKCGNESSFFQKGWLKGWQCENTKQAIRNASSPDNTIKYEDLREEKVK